MRGYFAYTPNPRATQVVAMRRSGSHAVISWLMVNVLPEGAAHVNNITRENGEWLTNGVFLYRNGVPEQVETIPENTPALLENYEDESDGSAIPRGARRILVVRDPYNQAASRIARGWDVRPDMWLIHANDALGRTHALGCDETILYNDWLAHDWPVVPFIGKGSSFDGTEFNGAGQRMDVLNRWRRFAEHPAMAALIGSEEVAELARELFPRDRHNDLPCWGGGKP